MTSLNTSPDRDTRSDSRRARLHPPLTDIPVGAIVIAATVDLISAARGGSGALAHELYQAGTFSLMVGAATMVLTICAGFIDRARFARRGTRQRLVANIHATVMGFLAALFVTEIIVRRHAYPHAHHTPGAALAMTFACLIVLVAGGALGGKLVYALGVGVAGHGSRQDRA